MAIRKPKTNKMLERLQPNWGNNPNIMAAALYYNRKRNKKSGLPPVVEVPDFKALAVANGVWKALLTAADGTNTYSARDTVGTFVNSDGYVQEMPPYGIRVSKSRVVENILAEATEQSRTTSYIDKWRDKALTSFPVIDLSSGTNFSSAWRDNLLTSFPTIDLSSGTNFGYAWQNNSLTSFPAIDLSSGTNFIYSWYRNSLTSFPAIDLSRGTNFAHAWRDNSLTDFPANMFDTCTATNFTNAFSNNSLDQTSVDGILVSIDTAGQSNGTLGLDGGTNSAPGTAGQTAKTNLESRGWTVNVNS